jgi:hypothetical protein
MAFSSEEKYAPRKMFLELAGFTSSDFSSFLKENNISNTEEGYPVFSIMSALNNARKKGRFGKGDNLDAELKREKIEGQRIANTLKMKKLISREAVITRERVFLQALANKVLYGAKLSAPRLPGVMNVRDIENIIIEGWESVVDALKEEADSILSWEDYAINIQPAGAGMVESSEESISSGDNEEDSITDEE